MPRFHFEVDDGHHRVFPDDEGYHLDSIDIAGAEAALT
jgi:hypothetical protein